MVTKTTEELDLMRAEIAAGKLPPDALERHFEAEARNVFGHDAKQDRKGNFIEQGIGAPGHETANHFVSILRYEGKEAYDKAVAELWKRNPKHAEALRLPKPRAVA